MKKMIIAAVVLAILGTNLTLAAPELQFDVETVDNVSSTTPISAELQSAISPEEYERLSAKVLTDNRRFDNKRIGGLSGDWNVVKTYDTSVNEFRPSHVQTDTSSKHELYFTRKFVEITSGILELKLGAVITGGDGAYFSFHTSNGDKVIELLRKDGKYYTLGADNAYTSTGLSYTTVTTTMHLRMRIDLDAQTYTLAANGVTYGNYPLARDLRTAGGGICELRYGSTKEAKAITLTANYVHLTHNYLLSERFVNAPEGTLPDYFTVKAGTVTTENAYDNDGARLGNTNNGNGASLKLTSSGEWTKMSGSFGKSISSGTLVFESYVLFPGTNSDSFVISLTNEGRDVCYIKKRPDNHIYKNDTIDPGKTYLRDLWYIIRIEADLNAKTYILKINGKQVGEAYDFLEGAPAAIDGFRIDYASTASHSVYVDDLTAFVKQPYPTDYVPTPNKPSDTNGYVVGINVCSLWRQGIHYGWDDITAYPELEPVLGYYDEGNPEVSDWEIKMMTEHGIDYQLFCWYLAENADYPIQHTPNNEALVDGYFNAKYKDSMNFAIAWENKGMTGQSLENFKKYVIPYWKEYFFNDPQYQTIDGKPVLVIFENVKDQFNQDFSNVINAIKTECDCYVLRIVQAAGEATPGAGFDGTIAYNWRSTTNTYDEHFAQVNPYSQRSDSVSTISVGMQYIGWGQNLQYKESLDRVGYRNPILTKSEMGNLATTVKSNLSKRTDAFKKMVNISTWNEYGEGTYVMPTQGTGFDYLEAIRQAFTDHNNSPFQGSLTAAQKQRINYLYPQDNQLLRAQMNETRNYISESNHTYAVNRYDYKIDISGQDCSKYLIKAPTVDAAGGELLVPIFPESGILSLMKCTYTWDKASKTLTVKNADHTVRFTVGQTAYQVDGVTVDKPLGNAITLYDGLPVIPLNVLAVKLGYGMVYYDANGNQVEFRLSKRASVMFDKSADRELIEARVPGKFEFDVEGDLEGWKPNGEASVTVENGSIIGTSIGYDPQLASSYSDFAASNYTKIYVRMKWSVTEDCASQILFDNGSGYQVVTQSLPSSSNGQFQELCFDVSGNSHWTGTISKLRFDPVSRPGAFEIDYIRLGTPTPYVLSFRSSANQDFKAKLPPAIYTGGSVDLSTLTANALGNTGSKLVGWSKTDGGEILTGTFTPTANTVLYPVWQQPFNITQVAFADAYDGGIRFLSLIDLAAKEKTSEYGFIVTREKLLNAAGKTAQEFTLDTAVNQIRGVAYKKGECDVIYAQETSQELGVVKGENIAVTAVITHIPSNAHADNFVIRPYRIVDGKVYYSPAVTKCYNDGLNALKEVFFQAGALM